VCIYFQNNNPSQSFKVTVGFKEMKNLSIKYQKADETDAHVELDSGGGTAAIILHPIEDGETTGFQFNMSMEPVQGRPAGEPNPDILRWVNSIWEQYDTDGNGTLDPDECWVFIKDHMAREINKADYKARWAQMDTDGSNSLD